MKKTIVSFLMSVMIIFVMSGCGSDPALSQFKVDIDNFCTKVSEIDNSINNIDVSSEYATDELLRCLDDLNAEFTAFAELDFPEEYDYLEELADEAGSYMNEAVNNYHKTYEDDSYNESYAEYAAANYERAYKRIQIIISFLHGEEPEDVNVTDTE